MCFQVFTCVYSVYMCLQCLHVFTAFICVFMCLHVFTVLTVLQCLWLLGGVSGSSGLWLELKEHSPIKDQPATHILDSGLCWCLKYISVNITYKILGSEMLFSVKVFIFI